MSASSSSRICILIPTFKRNDALLRLVRQAREFIDKYHGHNRYELCVTDSDSNNPIAPLPPELHVQYSINPGNGFDDNLYYFWLNNVDRYDFIFSISDDDLFSPWLNPLYMLDAAIDSGHQVVLFNHRYYSLQANGNIDLGDSNYPETELLCNKNYLLERMLRVLPSHAGTLCSTKLLKATLKATSEFRGTLHLYAVPILLAAAANTLLFSDYHLCLFNNDPKTDGAWRASEHVMNGLMEFLTKLKRLLPANLYSIAEAGFFEFYFRSDSWLRQQLGNDPKLKKVEQIREAMASR